MIFLVENSFLEKINFWIKNKPLWFYNISKIFDGEILLLISEHSIINILEEYFKKSEFL